jgi:NAD(P)-dependent dehydrogenase (short-subunit alcohol dehydrogenase family)
MEQLGGKVAVVTGAASGIGRALAVALAQEGMSLALCDVEEGPLADTADMARAAGAEVLAGRVDVSRPEEVEAFAGRTVDALGGLHLACNNAGVSGGGLTWEIDLATWEWVLGVNLMGVVHGLRSFTPRIIASGGGHVVNTASMAGLTSPPGMSPYNVAKHGVVTLSESMAQELALTHPEVGISVLCPGWVRTRIHEADRNRPRSPGEAVDADGDEAIAGMRDMISALIDGGLDPAAVAESVVGAVREGRFWVFTHPDWMPMVERRMQGIVSGEAPGLAILPGGPDLG